MIYGEKKINLSDEIKCNLLRSTLITLLLGLPIIHPVLAQDITISTWGGSYGHAQRKAIFDPFERLTGIKIKTQLQKIGQNILVGKDIPDLVDMEEGNAQLSCQQGLLLTPDFKGIVIPDKQPTKKIDANMSPFFDHIFSSCGVAHITVSTLIAFNPTSFAGKKPQTISDFFDLEKFPGKRGLHKSPSDILEWSLMASGVPNSQIYNLLSTERGLKIAFKQLDTIRKHIIWWETPDMAVSLLSNSTVVMTSGFNGRFFETQSASNPLTMIWDGQILDRSLWVIPASNKVLKPEVAKFIRFATRPEQMAKLAEYIPYGPTRLSALQLIGNHPEKGTSMREQLPTAGHHLDRALMRDTNWYAHTENFRQEVFKKWLSE